MDHVRAKGADHADEARESPRVARRTPRRCRLLTRRVGMSVRIGASASPASTSPKAKSVSHPRASNPAFATCTWVAGPPTLRRVMIRRTRGFTRPAPARRFERFDGPGDSAPNRVRTVAEDFGRAADVRLRVADVSWQCGLEERSTSTPSPLPIVATNSSRVYRSPYPTLKMAPTAPELRRQEIGLDDIVDVCEVPRLESVAVDDWPLFVKAAMMNRGTTAAYSDVGSCPGPNTLKYLRTMVSTPQGSPIALT